MSSYFDKSLKAVALAATVAIVGLSSLACAGPAQGNKVTDDDLLTAEQCIDNNTAGSVEPFEEDLLAEGLVNTELDKISITRGMCEEIIERTPGGSPIARAAVAGNLTQELQTIKESMEDASGKDVNGDGMVNREDKKTAESASFAAARAAHEALRRAPEEGSTDGGGIGELDVEPAAYLQDVAQDQYVDGRGGGDDVGGGGVGGDGGGGEGGGTASPTATAGAGGRGDDDSGGGGGDDVSGGGGGGGTASPTASPTATAGGGEGGGSEGGGSGGSGSGGGGSGGGGGGVEGAQMTVLPSHEHARTNASRAAQEEGADKKAAAAGGQCAATVGLTDVTLHMLQGRSVFDPPAKKLHWKDRDRTQLLMTPKTSDPIEQLERKVDQAEGSGKAEADCMQLGNQMEALVITDDALDITPLDKRKKEVPPENPITWRWDIVASEMGQHSLYINVTAHVSSPEQRGRFRAVPQNPPLFDDHINVNATGWEVFTNFVARRWPVLVPTLLTILTAIIILLVLPWWRSRHQPRELRDWSSGAS
jgi:hypothetical protein